jgi:hypothetical protein
MKRSPRYWFLAMLLSFVPLPDSSSGQMVTGEKMTGFASTFGLPEHPPTGWSVQEIACSQRANVLWNDSPATFKFAVKNNSEVAIRGHATFRVIHYGTRGTSGDFWKPIVFKIEDLAPSPVELDVPANGEVGIDVTPTISKTYGAYALVLDLGPLGKQFAAACVRVRQPDRKRVWQPTFALDLPRPNLMSEQVFFLLNAIGVSGARMEVGAGLDPVSPEAKSLSLPLDWANENKVSVMLTVGAGKYPQPLGRGRPWLNDDNSMKERVKEDMAWLPQHDAEFQEWVTNIAAKWGWPNGPVNAMELWNEPWEGVSISGWGADIPRYRELFTRMAQGVVAARKKSDVKVLIGGACSSSNTRDKLFCDGTDQFLPWLDFVSIHYQPLAADAALEPHWMHREGEYGRTKVWDTESWVANSDDRVAAVIASMRSMGQDRTAGIFAGNVYESQKPRLHGVEYPIVQAWAPAAAIAACQYFIGERIFREILFKNGLPWVYVFDGLPDKNGTINPDDGTLVVLGDLGGSYDKSRSLFRSVKLSEQARLELGDGSGTFSLFDFYGNRVPSHDKMIAVPLNGLGFFLRSDGSQGSFEHLVTEVAKESKILGIEPVEIVAKDLIAAPSQKPRLAIQLTDVLNRPIHGTLSVKVNGLELESAQKAVELNANESREILFTVVGGELSADNSYGLSATFDAGVHGSAQHEEAIHVNSIARRTIHVDGDLSEWSGVVPQNVGPGQHVGASKTEMAYLPFREWKPGSNTGTAKAYLAADPACFYFAAMVSTGFQPTVRFETRDDDQYFYPPAVTDHGKTLTWPNDVRRFSYGKNYDLPSGNGKFNVQIAFNVLPPKKKHLLEYPVGTMPRYMVYQDTDYEYALNQCDDGGTEVFCLARPGAPRKHFYPRQPKATIDGGPVKEAKLVIKADALECSIPWSDMPEVKQRLDAGQSIKFSFRVNAGRDAYELAVERSVSKENPLAFHNDFATHWASELEFGLEK